MVRFCVALALFAAGCAATSSGDDGDDDAPPAVDGGGGICTDGETRCLGTDYQQCVDGAFQTQQNCSGLMCHDSLGCVQCNPDYGNLCVGDAVHECNDNGTVGDMVTMCPLEQCDGGRCVDACGDAESSDSYIGCEYWPVDLHNAVEVVAESFLGDCSIYGVPGLIARTMDVCYDEANFLAPVAGVCDPGNSCAASPGYTCQSKSVCILDAQGSPFAIVVSNPHDTKEAIVTLEGGGSTQMVTVGAGQVAQIFPQMLGIADQSVPGPGVHTNAYKLTSSRPVVAYQFNPLNNVDVFSNDGSLLLPRHTFDTKYYVIGYPTLARRPTAHDYNGYLTIVASAAGMTALSITPTANVHPGPGLTAITAGTPTAITLNQGETLTLESTAGGDLTGTVIESTDGNTFAVFTGHVATAPSVSGSSCCADHLEDQVFPASTWGTSYAVARSQPRGSEPDRLRIMAQKPNTTVTLMPAGSAACPVLGEGEFCELDITGDTEITATEPIMVAHYLLAIGMAGSGVNPQGDPAIAFAVPTEQYRSDYNLLVPNQYATNFFAIVAPAGATVVLDGTDVSGQLAAFGSGTFAGARIMVTAGAHTLTCSPNCGVEIGGYDEAVSYLFAGGLDLEPIVVE